MSTKHCVRLYQVQAMSLFFDEVVMVAIVNANNWNYKQKVITITNAYGFHRSTGNANELMACHPFVVT